MPTVLRHHGMRVVVNPPPREHGPPHVHVHCADGQIIIDIASDSPFIIRADRGIGPVDASRALELVEAHIGYLMFSWRDVHA